MTEEDTTAQALVSRSDSYITLTPRSNVAQPPSSSSLAKEVLTRKWELAKKKSLPAVRDRDASRDASFISIKEKEGKENTSSTSETDTKESPTETDKTSEIDSVADIPEPDDEDLDAEEEEIGVFPTYLCELHDPKTMLLAEHMRSNRVEISLLTAPKAVMAPNKDKRMWGWHSKTTFRYEISVGLARTVFDCSPPKVLDVLKTLAKDNTIVEQLRLIETNYFRDTIVGSLKRLYPSAVKLSDEIVEVLEFISDIDHVLLHPAYLNLIGVTKGAVFHKEIQTFLHSHDQSRITASSSPPPSSALVEPAKCQCETYVRSVDRFVDLYKQHEEDGDRFSVVASESLMWTRGILSFYTDTVYLMDKRNFRPWRGLTKCPIYGFGRRKLFEIVRTGRKEWTFCHVSYGALATLTLERYLHHMNPYQMVAIKRLVPDGQQSNMREENICFVKKSKKVQGYRCLLMSEVITRGRVTTALAIEQAESPENNACRHYMTMSEISGAARESVCSSTLSVPVCRYKHSQQIHISGGSDVVAYLCLAASYDILVGGLSYWKERKY